MGGAWALQKDKCPSWKAQPVLYLYQGSSEKQNLQDMDRQMRGDLLQELAHMIMEAKKFYHPPFASQRTRKTGDVIQSETERLRTGDGGHGGPGV